jgi:hypothetical protein
MFLSTVDYQTELVKSDLTSLRSSKTNVILTTSATSYTILAYDPALNKYVLTKAHSFEERSFDGIKYELSLSDGSTIQIPSQCKLFTVHGLVEVSDLEIGTQLLSGSLELRSEGQVLSTYDQQYYHTILRMRQRLQPIADYLNTEDHLEIELLKDLASVYQTMLIARIPITWEQFCSFYGTSIKAIPNVREYIEYHYCSVLDSFIQHTLCPMYGQFITRINVKQSTKSDLIHTMTVDKYNSVLIKTKEVQSNKGYGVGYIVASTI